MFGKSKIIANALIEMNLGHPTFRFKASRKYDLMFLAINFFLKMRWMFTDQEELEILKDNYSGIIKGYPSSIDGISHVLLFHMELDGLTTLNLLQSKSGMVGFTSDFPLSYSNISIINIGLVFTDKIYQVLNKEEKEAFGELLKKFEALILDDDKDTSLNRLMALIEVTSAYRNELLKA